MIRRLATLAALLALAPPDAAAFGKEGTSFSPPRVTCPPSAAEEERLIALPLAEFAHRRGGWRLYAIKECYSDAANLMSRYLDKHGSFAGAEPMRWHQAQMLAFAERRADALAVIGTVKRLAGQRNAPPAWTLYIAGMEAYLRGQREALASNLDGLSALSNQPGPTAVAAALNADVLKGLLRCFDQPYKIAFRCRERAAARAVADKQVHAKGAGK